MTTALVHIILNIFMLYICHVENTVLNPIPLITGHIYTRNILLGTLPMTGFTGGTPVSSPP